MMNVSVAQKDRIRMTEGTACKPIPGSVITDYRVRYLCHCMCTRGHSDAALVLIHPEPLSSMHVGPPPRSLMVGYLGAYC